MREGRSLLKRSICFPYPVSALEKYRRNYTLVEKFLDIRTLFHFLYICFSDYQYFLHSLNFPVRAPRFLWIRRNFLCDLKRKKDKCDLRVSLI